MGNGRFAARRGWSRGSLTSQILNQGVALVYLEYMQMESQDTVSGMLVDQLPA